MKEELQEQEEKLETLKQEVQEEIQTIQQQQQEIQEIISDDVVLSKEAYNYLMDQLRGIQEQQQQQEPQNKQVSVVKQKTESESNFFFQIMKVSLLALVPKLLGVTLDHGAKYLQHTQQSSNHTNKSDTKSTDHFVPRSINLE